MVVYVFHLGNQRQLNGGDIGAATGRNWPGGAFPRQYRRPQTCRDPLRHHDRRFSGKQIHELPAGESRTITPKF